MSLRNLGKLFKSKKCGKVQQESIPIPIEGFDHSIQLLLAYTGKDISDGRISVSQSGVKTLPGGKHQSQGTAVLRYLGKCHGLAGADPFEDLEIDQIVEVFTDFRIKLLSIEREEDPVLKTKKLNTFSSDEALVYLGKFDAVVAANRGHLALNKLTWADFLVVGMWEHIKGILKMDCDLLFPNIQTMYNNIKSISIVNKV